MDLAGPLLPLTSLTPAVLMAAAMAMSLRGGDAGRLWRDFRALSAAALLGALATAALAWTAAARGGDAGALLPGLATGPWSAAMASLVQLLGTVIGGFSARYLEGEPHQRRYVAAFAGVLAAVHVLVLADHWLVLTAAWAAVGIALEKLLCFYPDRPFALLAAHKKRVADRAADALLLAAAALAWSEAGSGDLAALWRHLAQGEASVALQASAVCLVLAVALRTALLPVHGWLIQVMEAPTPVSALLHAGVVNLGGFVLIRFAPLLEAAPVARWLLLGLGLGTAALAGLVMLTRVSIKVRLAWSTVAQMGFMVLECAVGLYALAALHVVGHSLYKAHAFLSASSAVRASRLARMRGNVVSSAPSVLIAPLLAAAIVESVHRLLPGTGWPWWWSGVLALAWAPLLWLHVAREAGAAVVGWRAGAGIGLVAGLTLLVGLAHLLPLGVPDRPDAPAGVAALLGIAAMHAVLAVVHRRAHVPDAWHRWSYAGFYLDEHYTRLALRLWPARWAPASWAEAARPLPAVPLDAAR
ncbi:MAG: NADH-quinone oxidoreductase subunit L [Burkholderiales bacterium]|nr:NADH-quinone oxidoreductase subunit L [Burkholderiales bacterium]